MQNKKLLFSTNFNIVIEAAMSKICDNKFLITNFKIFKAFKY